MLVGLAATAGGGSVDRFWDRFAVWLWGTARLAPATVFGAAVISVVLALLWLTTYPNTTGVPALPKVQTAVNAPRVVMLHSPAGGVRTKVSSPHLIPS